MSHATSAFKHSTIELAASSGIFPCSDSYGMRGRFGDEMRGLQNI